MRRGAVRLPPGLRLARCCWGALRGCNGILMDRTVLVAEEQWRPGALQMPLHVVRQHAQQDVCSHPVIQPVVDRANMQVNCLEASPCQSTVTLDHLVPLEVSGATDQANLWPEPADQARTKDLLENRLHQLVCDGQASLADAVHAIASDWVGASARYLSRLPLGGFWTQELV